MCKPVLWLFFSTAPSWWSMMKTRLRSRVEAWPYLTQVAPCTWERRISRAAFPTSTQDGEICLLFVAHINNFARTFFSSEMCSDSVCSYNVYNRSENLYKAEDFSKFKASGNVLLDVCSADSPAQLMLDHSPRQVSVCRTSPHMF